MFISYLFPFARAKRHCSLLLQAALRGADLLVAYNVSTAELSDVSKAVINSKSIRRLVLAVRIGSENDGQAEIASALKMLTESSVITTIIKYADVAIRPEAKYPYRVVRGDRLLPKAPEGALPGRSVLLSSGDLFRVRANCECIGYYGRL